MLESLGKAGSYLRVRVADTPPRSQTESSLSSFLTIIFNSCCYFSCMLLCSRRFIFDRRIRIESLTDWWARACECPVATYISCRTVCYYAMYWGSKVFVTSSGQK
ncbi:hypothetical protein NP493_355g01019 [Ridgeia piscesae]|uniref:Uncharacterized protein n=1 Tax=Ridgeia piscesae TaxID=27915 RepID=A0AAD9L2Y2_RIDPI|nr:hypothetical protein NP493_355g01019 [Ridgeia piscesae]